jgi:hypothetical protein
MVVLASKGWELLVPVIEVNGFDFHVGGKIRVRRADEDFALLQDACTGGLVSYKLQSNYHQRPVGVV